MRIIQFGTKEEDIWKVNFTCNICGSILEVNERDIVCCDYSIDKKRYYLLCPVCEKLVKVCSSKIPQKVKLRIQSRSEDY